MEIFTYIETLPNIVQGIIASALFAFILFVGQKSTLLIVRKINNDKNTANNIALIAVAAEYHEIKVESFLTCIYGALHYFLKAVIVALISLIFSNINFIASFVGYFLSIYFLFRSLAYIPHYESLGKTTEDRKQALDKLVKK
jgi:hypothetical protein